MKIYYNFIDKYQKDTTSHIVIEIIDLLLQKDFLHYEEIYITFFCGITIGFVSRKHRRKGVERNERVHPKKLSDEDKR